MCDTPPDGVADAIMQLALRLSPTGRTPLQMDLFHAAVPDDYIAQVFAVMALGSQRTFHVLTKRHDRMRSLLSRSDWLLMVMDACDQLGHDPQRMLDVQWPLPNVWLGVTVEDQQRADLRIPALIETPAAVRFLSCEPLLGRVDLSEWLLRLDDETCGDPDCCPDGLLPSGLIDWVIAGGESGKDARIRATVFHDGPYQALADVEFATAGWVDWYNHTRLHSSLGMVPPVEYERAHYAALTTVGSTP